jgi:hypothetical protein
MILWMEFREDKIVINAGIASLAAAEQSSSRAMRGRRIAPSAPIRPGYGL